MDNETSKQKLNTNLLDQIRDYWNSRPCNIRHSLSPIGTKEYFNEVEARRYANEPHNYSFPEFHLWKGKRVLEIGCGIGTDAVNFARHGAIYTGVDLSSESINLAKKRFEVFDLEGRFIECNAEELISIFGPEEKFDLIYSFGVIHHAPRPEKVLACLPSLLADNGEVRAMLYAKNSWKNILINAGWDQPEAQDNCPQALTYTIGEARELFKQFNTIEINQDFIFPWIVETYVKYEYVKQPWFAAMPAELFRIMEKALGWHLLIKAKL
jgi:2-polyprenyl-3-methyl-5-hydroxy-6-metoxy-1,4-benzoquinol methylase